MLIATRILRLLNSPETQVRIRLFAPENGEGDWSSKYEIDWPTETWLGAGLGVDPIQALWAALQKIGVDLYTSEFHRSGKLVWLTPNDGYGFPVPRMLRDVLVGEDARADG